MMKFRETSRDDELTINITPLIDIVFLLLIFFMVSTNFNKFTQLTLSLPEVSKVYNNEQQQALNLKVTAKGEYYLNDIPITSNDKKTLMSAIKQLSNKEIAYDQQGFVISGDGNAPHQAIVTALDAAGELGFKNIKLAAVKK